MSGTFLDHALTALAEPMVFGGVMPFIFFGIFSVASYLGLTDVNELESHIKA